MGIIIAREETTDQIILKKGGYMGILAATAGVGVWIWKEFGEEIKGGFTTFLERKIKDVKDDEKLKYAIDKWMDFQWNQASSRYQLHLKKMYGHIRVLGSNEPVSIDNIFTDVYILEKPLAFQRFNLLELQSHQHEPEKLGDETRIPGLRVVQRKMGHRLYLLGKPGAGKTTFLKFIVHACLSGKFNKLPIFVTLKDWADSGLDLISYIVLQFDICQFPLAEPFIEYLLESGGAIILFDGLDEVQQEYGLRQRLTSSMQNFCNKYLSSQIIITCRVAASDYTFPEFTYLEMADFNDEQVQSYARKWFHKSKVKATQFLTELAIPENKGVRDLGRSPLLLSLICLAYDETLHIPQRRIELYEEALEALLKKWDATRNIHRDEAYHKLSLGRKRQMFARIAAETFEKGQIFFTEQQLAHQIENYLGNLPPNDAAEDLDGMTVLRAISAQHGIFVERAQGIFAFSHLTFQEYYAAKYIIDNAGRGTLRKLMQHLNDPRWREVFLLTASGLDDSGDFLNELHSTATNLIRSDPILLEFQQWSEKKAKEVYDLPQPAVRGMYFIMDLTRILDSTRARLMAGSLITAINQASLLVKALQGDFSFEGARALDHVPALAEDSTFNKAHALAFARSLLPDFERAYSHAICNLEILENSGSDTTLELSNSNKKVYLELIIVDVLFLVRLFTIACEFRPIRERYYQFMTLFKRLASISNLTMPGFGSGISSLPFPGQQDGRGVWKRYEKRLQEIIMQYLKIGLPWKLLKDQSEQLTTYFKANLLLLNCLEIAYVSDREFILQKILCLD